MEMQHILEILANLNTKMDANQADQARMEAEMKANRKTNKARMEANQDELLARS
jgi:hypothetical protein